MQYTLVVLDQSTYLVPEGAASPPHTHDSLAEWEVDPDEALAWQQAQLDAAVQKIGTMTQAIDHLLAGGSPAEVKLPVDASRGAEQLRRAALALRARGGGSGAAARWDGPNNDALAKVVDQAMRQLDED